MLVRRWMTTDVVTVTPTTSVANARRLLGTYGIRHLPVVDGGRVVGMVSSHDVRPTDRVLAGALSALQSDLAAGRSRAVSTVMRTPVLSVAPSDTIADVEQLLVAARVGAAPVLEGARLVGIISVVDCLRAHVAMQHEQSRRAVAHPAVEDDPDRWAAVPLPTDVRAGPLRAVGSPTPTRATRGRRMT